MNNQRKISVIGLGYVGLSSAVTFGKVTQVIGFDINPVRIQELNQFYDRNNEFSADELQASELQYTLDAEELKKADFYIVTVI